jgi:hypothetical protein
MAIALRVVGNVANPYCPSVKNLKMVEPIWYVTIQLLFQFCQKKTIVVPVKVN